MVFNSLQPIQILGCDETYDDGVFDFDTTNLEIELLNGLNGFDLTYTDENNNPLSSPLPNPFTTSEQTINLTLTSNTANPCAFGTTIEFTINKKPQFFSIPSSATILCNQNDSELQSEFASFDTTTFQTTILGTQTGMAVEYYDENNMQLPSPLPNPFTISSQNITVKVINSNDLNCFTTGTIAFQVLSLPNIISQGQEKFVCTNLPNYFVNLDAGLINPSQSSNYTYQWYLNNNQINGENSYNFQVNQAGMYSVSVTNTNNCENIRTILVNESNSATINDVEIYDFTENNSLLVVASGSGSYLYSLDNISYQASSFFEGLLPGIYTVYVKDERGCGTEEKQINIMGAPKFFTPNNDGYNDFWNIKGIDARLNASTIIRIFDRYGKFLDQINPIDLGWNGVYNNQHLPADDYWYTIEFKNGRIVKGHFSLLR